MDHEVLDRAREIAPFLAKQGDDAEALGRLPDETVAKLKELGIVRLLQPIEFGGYEADPDIFFRAVMEIARNCGASGWVSSVIGVHPHELAVMDRRLQEEVWGYDPDTWVGSSYMSAGFAKRVEGGYELTGHWSFSSGCEASDWVILGAVAVDEETSGSPRDVARADESRLRHVVLPKSDYRIVEGSWNVVGLCGTGSKDIVVDHAFVPEYRTASAREVREGVLAARDSSRSLVYRMPFGCMFGATIAAPVIGIAQGALDVALKYQSRRTTNAGPVVSSPVTMTSIADAASEIEASRASFLSDIHQLWGHVRAGDRAPIELRAQARRDQIAAAWRATRAVDSLFDHAGGGAIRRDTPLQRFWRDAHAGLHHQMNSRERSLHSHASVAVGGEPFPGVSI